MMLIILVNLVIILMLLLGFVLFLNRREKQHKQKEMERMLIELEENATSRQKQIVNNLTAQIGMSEQTALEKLENFVSVEKQLTHKFLEILMNQQPATNFYQYSCECLDNYVQLIADNLPEPSIQQAIVEKQAAAEGQKTITSEQSIEPEENQVETSDAEPEQVIETNKDTAPETNDSPEKDETNQVEEDEFSEEPDWGDAFAETGEEMDVSLLEENGGVKT